MVIATVLFIGMIYLSCHIYMHKAEGDQGYSYQG